MDIKDSKEKVLEKMHGIKEDLLALQRKVFGERHFRIKSAAAIAFLVVACMSTMGTLTYIGLIDQSQYEVSGLTVKQNGTGLDVNWDAEDCDGYEVFIFENGERPRSIETDTNSCRIELEELGKDYKIVVTAKGDSGVGAGAKATKIFAEKVEQKIEVAKDPVIISRRNNKTTLKNKKRPIDE